jgi:hypothetical protein
MLFPALKFHLAKNFRRGGILQIMSRVPSAVLCPSGHLADVQNGSRPFCLNILFAVEHTYRINMEQLSLA